MTANILSKGRRINQGLLVKKASELANVRGVSMNLQAKLGQVDKQKCGSGVFPSGGWNE